MSDWYTNRILLCQEIRKFLDSLCQIGIASRDYRGPPYSGKIWNYKFQTKILDLNLIVRKSSCRYLKILNTRAGRFISFSEFFELLRPEVKKHFIYHLDLFQKLES